MNEAQRIARLEERLAWLERHVVEQDKVMLALSEDIARLQRQLKTLTDRMAAGNQGEPDIPANERPPHY